MVTEVSFSGMACWWSAYDALPGSPHRRGNEEGAHNALTLAISEKGLWVGVGRKKAPGHSSLRQLGGWGRTRAQPREEEGAWDRGRSARTPGAYLHAEPRVTLPLAG